MAAFPKQYEENMKALLGEEGFCSYAATFEHPVRSGLRVNTLKITPQEFLERKEKEGKQDLRPVPWCPSGYYYEEETTEYSKHPDYAAGLYYLQEPSAMAPAAILPVKEGDHVLDLCAAPGGKSTYLAAKLGSKGVLVSNDISPSRAKALLKNLELTGTMRAVVLSEAPYALSKRFPDQFDKILVDAPCSGEGMFHKEPDIMKNWEQYGNEYYAKLQREILPAAYQMLKPGGMLLYSTCTFHPMEDEQMILDFTKDHPDMKLLPIRKVGGMEDGHPEWTDDPSREDLRMCARFWPQKLEGQGHFTALLQKEGKPSGSDAFTMGMTDLRGAFSSSDLKLFENWCQENLKRSWQKILPKDGYLSKIGTMLYYSPIPQGSLKGLRVLRCGILLGELKKDRFEPSQAFAMTLTKQDVIKIADLPVGSDSVKRYLKGETLTGEYEDGWNLVLADGYPLGWGKAVRGILKNKYLKGWIQN
ncbi:MAG: RsmB/NOP family class I SAM-dependent RNA methyltransferase [Firmicutes bacterium]|nr:RsmB/NOP family class I SAM-dependent RNA methyltransferase [Bacillota bacterium]